MPASTLMFQGTASHVGKSVLTTALCRILHKKGIRVAPFKAVNMSNNAWVTRDGGEMATAQAVQAKACGIEPEVSMNPVLFKPTAEHSSQVIVLGKPMGVVPAADFSRLRETLLKAIETSLQRLMSSYDFIVIEGAGSPAEVNLRQTDLANMVVAHMAQAPVVLVADIERGGAFAQLVGTLELIEPKDRDRVKGFIINKFRGDRALLEPGLRWLEERTGRPVLGVVPFLSDLRIPEEDSLGVPLTPPSPLRGEGKGEGKYLLIQVIRYPTIANFTDFDPLHQEPDVAIQYLAQPPPPKGDRPDLLILPGSKSTMGDLDWLKRTGLDRYIAECAREGVEVLGICGGFQMLGGMIYDPSHVESQVSAMPGLGLLPTNTLFLSSKVTAQVGGIHIESGEPVRGYEIHMGRLQGARRGKPVFRLKQRGGEPIDEWDGCQALEGKVWGTYLHGVFDEEGFRHHLLKRLGRPEESPHPHPLPLGERDKGEGLDPYDHLVEAVRDHLWLEKIMDQVPWVSKA